MAARNEPFYGLTDTGRMRDNNEDAFIAQPVGNGRYIAGCVIDGVGGYDGGEVAAEITRDTILQRLQHETNDIVSLLQESLLLANERIVREKEQGQKYPNMACVVTLVLADPQDNQFYYAHVGDTRLYLLRDQSLVKVTHDHSFVGFLEDSKRLSESEAMQHPKRNEINKALGFDPNIRSVPDYVETGVSPFLPGDLLLLCSDGLSDLVDNRTMTAILTSSQTLAAKSQSLIRAANEAGGKDNITVVLIHNTRKPVKQRAAKPAIVKKNETREEVKETPAPPPPPPPPVVTSNRGLIIGLVALCLVLAVIASWQWLSNRTPEDDHITAKPRPRTAEEQSLVNRMANSTFLTQEGIASAQPIVITDTITVQRDSLIIKGAGTVLKSDSAYNGPALVIPAGCKYVYLEDLVFENFAVAIAAQGRVLHLRNVQFRQCGIPVQYQFLLPENKAITGFVGDTINFRTDTISNKRAK